MTFIRESIYLLSKINLKVIMSNHENDYMYTSCKMKYNLYSLTMNFFELNRRELDVTHYRQDFVVSSGNSHQLILDYKGKEKKFTGVI